MVDLGAADTERIFRRVGLILALAAHQVVDEPGTQRLHVVEMGQGDRRIDLVDDLFAGPHRPFETGAIRLGRGHDFETGLRWELNMAAKSYPRLAQLPIEHWPPGVAADQMVAG